MNQIHGTYKRATTDEWLIFYLGGLGKVVVRLSFSLSLYLSLSLCL